MFVFSLFVLSFLVIIFLNLISWFRQLPYYRIGNFPTPPDGYFLIGHAPHLNTSARTIQYINENLNKYGGFARLNIGSKVMLAVSNYKFLEFFLKSNKFITKSNEYQHVANWLGNGLILSTGSHWKAHRKILTPAFHFQMMDNHVKSFRRVSDILVKKFRSMVDKESIDVYPIVSAFALDAVCESSMATSVNAQENDRSSYVRAVRELCRILMDRTFHFAKMFDILFRFHPDYKVFNDSVRTIHEFDDAVIRERKSILNNIKDDQNEKVVNEKESEYDRSRNKNPFLDILLKARYENGEPLPAEQIREEVDTIMFAGYETTASAISFTLYNLAKHPEVQKIAFEEQKVMFGNEENPNITYADLCNMKYLEMVIKESLRLFPSVPIIGREMTEDYVYDGKLLPKGLSITICIFSLNRDPNLWPDPLKFDPTRFEDEISKPAFAFLSFSAGPRNCIGQKFAMIEIKEVVSKILRNFELLPPTPDKEPILIAEVSLKSSNGICVKLKPRTR